MVVKVEDNNDEKVSSYIVSTNTYAEHWKSVEKVVQWLCEGSDEGTHPKYFKMG